MLRQFKSSCAFTLLELSIVLVIIGLIVGGIVVGASMVRAAEMRAIVGEISQFQTAVRAFKDKYDWLPGDMPNASRFWGYPGGSAANCPATAGTGTATCDGDGDGEIDLPAAASQYGELFTFWQHLVNAELIQGTYTGMAGAANNMEANTDNSPQSKVPGSLWSAYFRLNAAGGSPVSQQARQYVADWYRQRCVPFGGLHDPS